MPECPSKWDVKGAGKRFQIFVTRVCVQALAHHFFGGMRRCQRVLSPAVGRARQIPRGENSQHR